MTMRHTFNEINTALDYAHQRARSSKFCGKMCNLYRVTGHLTSNQIDALLRMIEEERR